MADDSRLAPESDGPPADASADDLWLVSYADLLTLLLGFFVLIISSSVTRPAKFEQLAASIDGTREAPLTSLKVQLDGLVERGGLAASVITREDGDGLSIELKEALLFDSGSAEVRPNGRPVIAQLAQLLRNQPQRALIIEGHTDDIPIRNDRFASNWELSTQRAINVLEELTASGIPRERMSVRGYADTRPRLTTGPLEEQRLANRRVVVRVE